MLSKLVLKELEQKFSALNRREKGLIIAALCVILWGSWDAFFYTPFTKQQTAQQQHLIELQTQLVVQQQLAIQLQIRSHNNPNLIKQQQLAALKVTYQDLQQKMSVLDKKFVPPERMAAALYDLLKRHQQLSLIKLDTLPVAPLLETAKQPQHPIYKHGLILRFSGSYLATLKYLTALETMPWNFIWGSIDYQVKSFPIAEITLRVYTLSFEKDWLDV